MAKLVFVPVADRIDSGTYLVYAGACGTGGMLTVAEETLTQIARQRGKQVAAHLYGQEINSETYAIAKADLLLKGEGEAADNIVGGPEHSTLSNDAFPSREFDFMLSNPPYGKNWKSDLERMGGKKDMRDPRFVIEHAGDPEYSLVTRSSDGQMLFLANKLSKMKQDTPLGSRIAEVHNGSSLFTGDAGQGESNIRRWIIENDWLEAIVALPLNMFYNTGIATYIWVLTNRKPSHRRGKVQLIDATQWLEPLRKNLGKKNCELSEEDIQRICDTFLAFEETEQSKIFPNRAFGYWKVTVERPLRLAVDLSPEHRLRFRAACQEAQEEPIANVADRVAEALGAGPHLDFNRFMAAVETDISEHGVKLTAKRSKLLQTSLATRAKAAEPVIKKIHKPGRMPDPIRGLVESTVKGKCRVVEYEPDSELRDTEQVPLLEEGGIEAFLRREVLPYEDHWRPMEVAFGQGAYDTNFDGFMRHYLTLKTNGEIPNIRAVYEAFKSHARSPEVEAAGIDALVADIHTYAGYYCAMALDKETNKDLSLAFRDLRDLKVDVAFPFLLELYDDHAQGRLPTEVFVRAVRLVEAYVFRRAVCTIPTNSLNKTFATFGRVLQKDRYIESIQAHFLTLLSYRRFPRDEEFKHELSVRDLYNFSRRSYWLRRLENHGRKERVPVDEYTIEHILPQNENLSAMWREAIGPEWRHVQETWLHTLGNLTLTGYNAEYSDRSFAEKRDMQGGFKESPLRLNDGLGVLGTWSEATIQKRAKRLAEQAVQVWTLPVLPTDVLETFRLKADQPVGYTLHNHSHLAPSGPMRPLFETFRKAVLALDPCVSEEVLKLYVAYKAETNFVDVVPQKSRLRLSLNMHFHELHDPRSLTKDVTNLGRWGNGDVEVVLRTPDELPYVMGLVRQAFEKQMGNGEAEA